MNKNIIKNRILPWIPVFIWMFIIFSLSSQPANVSNSLSKEVTKLFVKVIGRFLPIDIQTCTNGLVLQFNHFVRKFAHFSIYFLLGILVTNAFVKNGLKGIKLLTFSLLLCIFFAISDEVHQLYVPGRGGQFKDVLLDSTGAFFGIILLKFLIKVKKMTKI